MKTLKTFDEFLIKEYENIAAAHFESQKQFALFFRYYTLFYSVPIVIFFYNENKNLITSSQFAWLLIFLFVIGVLFYCYAVNLKHEAVLYARTVNGIRNHFYKGISKKVQKRIRTLPIDIGKPTYLSLLNPVLLIIMLVNILSLEFGLSHLNVTNLCLTVISGLAAFGIHIFLNRWLSRKQEKTYPSGL